MSHPRITALTALAVVCAVAIGLRFLPSPASPPSLVGHGAAVRDVPPPSQAMALPEVPRRAAAVVAGRVAESTRILRDPQGRAESELRAIAQERRSALRDLIVADPEAALACRLTYQQRRALPASLETLLETPVDGYGRLEVIAWCGEKTGGVERFVTVAGERRQAFVAGARIQSTSRDRLPVHGVAVGEVMAVAADPYRLPDQGELGSAVGADGLGLEVLVGDEQRLFGTKNELDEWADRTRAAEAVLPSVLGQRRVLFVMVDFSDAPGAPTTEEQINRSMASVNAYYKDMSANRLSFSTTVLPVVIRAPLPKANYSANNDHTKLMSDALAGLANYEYSIGNRGLYAQSSFQHVALLFSDVPGFASALSPNGWAGKADAPGSRVWFNGDFSAGVMAHELGHNLGLQHAYAWKPSGGSPVGPGLHVEYGDPFDVMGTATSSVLGHVSTPKKRAIGLISDANVVSIRSSGEFRIFRHDGDVEAKAVSLVIDAGGAYDYWVEYRKVAPGGMSAYSEAMAAGIQLHWNKLPNFTPQGGVGTYLLDMTPGSAGDMKDSTLTLGNSFYDSTFKIRITPLRSGSSAEGDWIDVAVVLGDTSANRAPSIQSAGASETAFARVPVNLTARAIDPDGNAVLYQWDLGDGKPVYSTEAGIQKMWMSGGTYAVTVRAFDVYGGESRQNLQVRVDDPLGAWTRAIVPGVNREDLLSVCYGGGRFVAVGAFATCASSDGKQWVRNVSGASLMYAYAVAYGAGRYVAVGGNWNASSQSYNTGIFYSSDGLSWYTAPTAGYSDWLYSVAYGAGRFVAVGDSGSNWISSDGRQWQAWRFSARKTLRGICFNGSEFVAVGDSGTAVYSRDGVTWYDVSLSDANTDYGGISWLRDSGGVAIVPMGSGYYVMSDWRFSDLSAGVAWKASSLGRWQGVTRTYLPFWYRPSLATVAGGDLLMTFPSSSELSPSAIAVSSDGLVWSSANLASGSLGALRGGAEGNGRIVLVGNGGQVYYSADGLPALARQPQAQEILSGARASLSVAAYATGPFTYQWMRNGVWIPGATSDTLSFASASVPDSGSYSVAVSNSRGVTVSAVATITVRPPVSAPIILAAPSSRVITQGASTQLTVSASGTPTPTYQWLKDGAPIPGATGSSYNLTADGSASGGAFSVEVTNSVGKVTTGAASVRVIPTNRLANLSVRTGMEAGQNLIVGAVMAEGSKAVLLRAAGPALNLFGLAGLPDPSLDLFTGGSKPSASNDDWNAAIAPLFQSVGAFGFVVGSKDAAMNPTIGGAFTVQVKGAGTGTVLVEAYDLGAETSPRLVNVSARHYVGTGADVLIAGFVVSGSGTKQVLIRAVGPTLTGFGVDGALTDPQLEVLDSGGRTIGSNDNWSSSLSTTFSKVGAFPLVSGSRDAAALVTLAAGASYTVKVSGVGNTTGEALIEIYEVF